MCISLSPTRFWAQASASSRRPPRASVRFWLESPARVKRMNRCSKPRSTVVRSATFTLFSLGLLSGQQIAFDRQIYPILERAGCRNCHNVEGVAAATRLHFPEESAAKAQVDSFGKSLVELVDRQNPEKSILLLKPTLRIPHTGGERIVKGSADETALKSWIGYLTKLSGPELDAALRYRQDEARGSGVAPRAVLRRLTHSQYNHTVRDIL